MKKEKIIFFDGYCNLCNGFVNFIIRLDKKNKIFFAPLNGKKAEQILSKKEINSVLPDSVIFYHNNVTSFKSKAVIDIFISLGGFYKLVVILKVIPSFILNFLYDTIAKNRYSWFGKRESCKVPDKKVISKFLE